MRIISSKFIYHVCVAVAAATLFQSSARSQTATPQPAANRGFARDVCLWLEDTAIRPKQPFELVPGKDANGWAFVIEPYGWSPGLYGKVGYGRLPVGNANLSPIDILKTLNWGAFLRGEVRKGRWGVLADGFYAKFSTSGDPQDSLYKSLSAESQQSMVSLALAYRVLSDKRYYGDIYAGGRFNYLGASVSAQVNRQGIEELSQRLINTAAVRFAPGLLAKYPGLQSIPASTWQNAKATAVRELSDRIEEKLPTSAASDCWWIDPIIGLRGQVNFTRWLFAAGQADVGGFGVGSQITWNMQATLGVNFSRNIALETGYRYMYIDYDRDNLLYNVNMPGIFTGLIFKF
jgi:hypothetical protein